MTFDFPKTYPRPFRVRIETEPGSQRVVLGWYALARGGGGGQSWSGLERPLGELLKRDAFVCDRDGRAPRDPPSQGRYGRASRGG